MQTLKGIYVFCASHQNVALEPIAVKTPQGKVFFVDVGVFIHCFSTLTSTFKMVTCETIMNSLQ